MMAFILRTLSRRTHGRAVGYGLAGGGGSSCPAVHCPSRADQALHLDRKPGERVSGQPQMTLQAHEPVPSPPGQNERREGLPSPDGTSSRDKPAVRDAE